MNNGDFLGLSTDTWKYIVSAITGSGVISGTIGWFLGRAKNKSEILNLKATAEKSNQETINLRESLRKTREETEKLATEVVQNALNVLQKVQDRRNSWEEKSISCGDLAQQLMSAMKNNSSLEEVNRLREACCAELLNYVIPRFRDYAEFNAEYFGNSADKLCTFIRDFVLHELRRYADWLRIFNNQNVLKHLEKNPARMSPHSLQPFKDLIMRIPLSIRDEEHIEMMFEAVKKELTTV